MSQRPVADFDRVVIADWSSASAPSPRRPSADAIWLGSAGAGGAESRYFRSRATAEAALADEIATAGRAGWRLLIGFDFTCGYPAGFAARLTGEARATAVWRWLAGQIADGADNANNRFAVAAKMNRRLGPAPGPFWGRPAGLDLPDLPAKKTIDYAALALAERRTVEHLEPRAQPVWKLYTTGAAGAQGLVGQPMLHRLARRPGVAVWPFMAGAAEAKVVLCEVYASLLAGAVRAEAAAIRDEAQVRLLARALAALARQGALPALFAEAGPKAVEEGWILAAGHGARLAGALACG